MTLSPGQAAAALDDIERTEQRTRAARSYSAASDYLLLWGVIWMIGYGACAVLPPERWGLAWLPLAAIGMLVSFALGKRSRRQRGAGTGTSAQTAVMGLAIFAFIAAVYYLFQPRSHLPYLVFPSLVAGLVYTLAGAVAGMPRFIGIGAGIFVLTLAGYVAAPQWTSLWVAIAGGGGLVLGGLWLRKA